MLPTEIFLIYTTVSWYTRIVYSIYVVYVYILYIYYIYNIRIYAIVRIPGHGSVYKKNFGRKHITKHDEWRCFGLFDVHHDVRHG